MSMSKQDFIALADHIKQHNAWVGQTPYTQFQIVSLAIKRLTHMLCLLAQKHSLLLPVLLIALGFFITWYVFVGSLDSRGDDPGYLPGLLLMGLFSIAYGAFLFFRYFLKGAGMDR
jgi:hypothetical protein